MGKRGQVAKTEVERRVAAFKATCRDKGIRLTPQRLEVFREVASSLEHPDAQTVYQAVHARMPSVSLDTVYRTLWMLNDLGLVSTLGLSRENVRFDGNPRKHHHFVCVQCGLTRDFENKKLDALRLPDSAKAFGKVLSTRIEVCGVCEDCSRKKGS